MPSSQQIGQSINWGFSIFQHTQLFDYQCSMLTRTYSLAQLTTLLTTTRQQVTDILMNPSLPNNQRYFQNFTTISLRTLKYINHYLNQIHADQQLGSLIDSIINALNDTLADYKGRNIFNDSCRVFPLGEDDKEEDQIYHFMNTRNKLIPLECLGSPEMDQQRLELAEFVQSMEKKRSTHYKQPKKSAQIPIKEANKLKVFRKATFDPRLTTVLEQENKNKLFRAEKPQINIRESQEMEVQTDLGTEAEKLTDKENIELRSQDQSMLTSDVPVIQLKKSQMSEIIENGNDSDKNKLSTKSHKRLGNKKSGKPKKKGKNNEPLASKLYSRQNSRNVIPSEQSTQKLQLSQQPSIRCFKTEKENLAISSQQVNFTFNNLNRTDISLAQSNQSTPSEDIKSKREIIEQQRLNGSPKSIASRKKIGFWPQQTQSMRKINLSNFSRKDISDTEKKISQNEDTINKSLKQIKNKQIHSEPQNLFTTFSKEQRQKIEPQQPLQTIVEAQELVVPSPMRVKKKDLRAMMAKSPTIYPTTNSFQYKGQAVQKAQGTYKEQSGNNNRRITSLNMKPEYLQENTEKKKNAPKGFQTQNSSDVRDKQNGRKEKKVTNSTFKRQQKQKQAVEDLIQQGERPQSVVSRNSQDALLQNQYSRAASPKDNQMSLFKVKKASSGNNNKFYATMDNFGKYMSSQQKNAASRGNSLIKVVNKTSSVHQQFLSTAASTKPGKNSNPFQEFSRMPNFRKKNQQERLSSINFKKTAQLHEQKDGSVTDKNELKTMCHKYASESSNGSLHPIQEQTCRLDCFLSRNPHKINQSNVISGALSQEQLKSDKKKGFPKKGGHKSVHTSLDLYDLRELSKELRQKGRKQTLEQYLQLIQLTHQRFCGNNCSHMTKLFKKQNGGKSTQDETVIDQLVRIYKKENLKPRKL